MKVKDLMITDVVIAYPETTLKEVLKLLFHHNIGGVPVVDQQNQLVGYITDGDILRFIKPTSAKDYNFFTYFIRTDGVTIDETIFTHLDRSIDECMTQTELVTLSVDDKFESVVSALSEHHFKKIPVIDEDRRVVGVISRGDVIRSIVKNWL